MWRLIYTLPYKTTFKTTQTYDIYIYIYIQDNNRNETPYGTTVPRNYGGYEKKD